MWGSKAYSGVSRVLPAAASFLVLPLSTTSSQRQQSAAPHLLNSSAWRFVRAAASSISFLKAAATPAAVPTPRCVGEKEWVWGRCGG